MLRRLVIPTAITLGLALLLSIWLVRSDGGRDWLLARVIGVLPQGATLRWDRIEGTLAGPLEIHGVHFDYKGSSFDARRLRIDHGFWPLLSGRLDIHSLTLEHALLVLPPDDTPLRWPDVLPVLDMPITVAVHKLQVRDFELRRVAVSWAKIASIHGGFTLSKGELHLRDVVAISNRGWLNLSGDYLPRDNFHTALVGRLVFPKLPGSAPAQATLVAKGDLDDFLLSLQGRAPAPLSVRLRLKDDSNKTHWSLDAGSSHLLLQQLGLPEDLPYAFKLHAVGDGGNALVQGRIARDDFSVVITPSRLSLDQGLITAAPLALSLAQGPVSLNGTLMLEGKNPQFDMRLRSAGLQLSPQTLSDQTQAVSARGDLRMHGHWQAWSVEGNASFLRAGRQATVTLAGQGDARHLALASFLAKTPGGSLRGSGEVHWDPLLGGKLQTELSGFDPGYFLPDYPGALSGKLDASGQRNGQGQWSGDAHLADLRGSLRKRPVQGQARIQFAGDSGDGELSLSIGNSQVEAGGRYGQQVDLHAQFSPLDLSDLWAGAAGRLQGRLAMRGARAAPSYDADLQGAGLVWGEFAAAQLSAKGHLPASGRDGDLRLAAAGVSLAGEKFDRGSLALTGSVAAFHARLSLAGEVGSVDAAATAAGQGQQWRGRIEELEVAPRRGPAWRLQSAAGYRYEAGNMQLDHACLLPSTAGGQLCAQAQGTHAAISGSGLPLMLAEPWLPDNALALRPFGEVDFDGQFAREAGGAWSGHAQLRSASGGLRIIPELPHDVFNYSDLLLDLKLQQAQLTLTLAARLPKAGTISGHLETGLSATAPLRGELHLDVRQLDWMELLSTDLAAPIGELSGTLLFGGQLDAPAISGDARLGQFSAELPALGLKLHDGEFTLRGAADGQAHISGQVTSGEGQLRVDGSLSLRDRSSPLELTLRGENILVARTPDLDATMSPDLQLRYADGTLHIRGSVGVPSARVDLERLDHSVSPSADVVVLDPRQPTSKSVFLVDTDVQLRLGEAVRLRGFGLDGTLGGSLRIIDRPGRAAQASGTLDIAGRYSVYGRALTITRGRLGYVNSAYDNPTLDIQAEREFEGVTVGVRVRGSALAPETTVTSSPAMATAEAMSWLVLGRPLSTASGSETQQISASALALSAGSNMLAQKLGTRLGLDSAGVNESRALGGSTFMVGKQISPRLFVSYGLSLVGTGQVLTLKYLLAHGLDVSLESSTVETAGSVNWRKEK